MRDGEYWRNRFKQMEESQNDRSLEQVMEIQEQFERSLAELDKKIAAWYQRLADNNDVSMVEAKKMLSQKELKEFRWSVEEYIKYGRENAENEKWVKELENASARVHIERLEALKYEIQGEMEKLFGNYTDSVAEHIRDTYIQDYYHTAFEIQKGIGVGSSLQRLDEKVVESVVTKPWAVDGKNFSERIWQNKTKLINTVHQSLSKMCITGASPETAVAEIAKEMNVSKRQARTLVMTESAVFANKARQDSMIELGVEEFEVVETLDGHTCSTCADMDGKHFPMSQFQIGVTAPVFHPRCRGCTCPYFDDEFTFGEERAARDEDGKVYYVPADMTYREWKEAFVDGGHKNGLVEIERSTKSTKHKNFSLTFDRRAKEYRQKYIGLGENEDATHSLANDVLAMLKHRNGTNYEDLTFVNSITGKHKMQTKYNVEGKVKPTEEMYQLLAESEPYTIIAVHNHPQNSSPSVSDLKVAYIRKYKYGLVACHDGKVFKYIVTKPITKEKEFIIEMRLVRLDNALKSELSDSKKEVDKILNQLYDEGIELEVM